MADFRIIQPRAGALQTPTHLVMTRPSAVLIHDYLVENNLTPLQGGRFNQLREVLCHCQPCFRVLAIGLEIVLDAVGYDL